MSPSIEFRDVYRHFDEEAVLRGLSFAVEPGQIYAFLGRNGSGKTTALRILMGRLRPVRGQTFVLGTNSQHLGPEDRQRIGYVTEGQRMYGAMKVGRLLEFEQGTRPGFNRKFVAAALDRCKLEPRKYVGLLSRGQRAQLALIIAVADSPEVLVFDDPAMGLDAVMRREFLDAMIDFLAERGTTVLFSSHVLTDVERVADRIGILQDGRLLVDATLEDLKRRVQKRVWIGNGSDDDPPESPRILRRRRGREAWDLTLLDVDPQLEAELQDGGARLLEPVVPSLEDLFLDLTTEADNRGILSPLAEEM